MVGPRRRNAKTFTDIGTVLQNILPKYRPSVSPALLAVWDIWDHAVGTEIATNARPAAFKGDLLLIHVTSSAWLHHLRLLQEDLLEKINRSLEQPKVRELKFKIGPI